MSDNKLKGTIGERFFGSLNPIYFPDDFSKNEFKLRKKMLEWFSVGKSKEEAIKIAKEEGYTDCEIKRTLPFTDYNS